MDDVLRLAADRLFATGRRGDLFGGVGSAQFVAILDLVQLGIALVHGVNESSGHGVLLVGQSEPSLPACTLVKTSARGPARHGGLGL